MKKIRTILAYYNGEKFIDEQLQSIVDQKIPEGYEHEIYVYDDGSHIDSLKYLIGNWGKSVKIIADGKNEGIFKRYFLAFYDAMKAGVDILFFADQDDYFEPNKYVQHILKHENGFMNVSSRSDQWIYKENKLIERKSPSMAGHNWSINLNGFRSQEIDFKALSSFIEKHGKSKFAWANHHDTPLFLIANNIERQAFIPERLTKWRIHSSSTTNSGISNIRKLEIWSDSYGYYFEFVRPLSIIFGKKISIWKYNVTLGRTQPNPKSSVFKSYFDTFSMWIRCKFLRNLIDKTYVRLLKKRNNKK